MGMCPNCNAVVSPGLQSCNSCGTPLNQQGGGFCGSCGTPLPAKYSPCPQCGHVKTTFYNPNAGSNPQPGSLPVSMLYKSEGITLILSILLGLFLLQGIGHMYVGKIGRGAVIMIGAIFIALAAFVTLFLIIPYFIIFIWQIIDARKICMEYNRFVHANGRPPW